MRGLLLCWDKRRVPVFVIWRSFCGGGVAGAIVAAVVMEEEEEVVAVVFVSGERGREGEK